MDVSAFLVYLWLLATTLTCVVAIEETYETVTYTDESGHEHEEYAFRAPMKGFPPQVLDMYCASMKFRLYWNVFRDTILDSSRKAIYLRRMQRLAKHIFAEIRDVDEPFNATRLSVVDEYFAAVDGPKQPPVNESDAHGFESIIERRGSISRMKQMGLMKIFVKHKKSGESNDDLDDQLGSSETRNTLKELEKNSSNESIIKLKQFLKEWAPKIGLGIYTRVRTMWWMMMSCLFAKYYLWDPALDEFIKLKKNLAMYPDLQLMRLQDLSCKPIIFFRRIIDVCKIINPLFNIDFGTLSLDNLTRFKGGK